MIRISTIQRIAVLQAFSLILVIVLPILLSNQLKAAGFAQAYVRFDRLKAATGTGGLVCANPGTTNTANVDVQVTFPDENSATDFTVSTTAGHWAAVTTDIPSGTSAWPGITAATATISGQTVTWTYAANQTLNNGTIYCFRWTNTSALTTSSAGTNFVGTITTRTTAAATIDTTKYATAIISDDQIVVSATVPATFSFALSGNTDSIGTLSTTTASSSGRTVTIGTNAASGWVAWVKSANAALNSASTGATIATAGTVNDDDTDLASTTGYVLDVNITTDSGTGTGTVTQAAGYGQEYDGLNATSGGTLSTTFQPIAASNGTTDGDVLTLIERAKITAVQAAATDYTDTLTVVAAGRF